MWGERIILEMKKVSRGTGHESVHHITPGGQAPPNWLVVPMCQLSSTTKNLRTVEYTGLPTCTQKSQCYPSSAVKNNCLAWLPSAMVCGKLVASKSWKEEALAPLAFLGGLTLTPKTILAFGFGFDFCNWPKPQRSRSRDLLVLILLTVDFRDRFLFLCFLRIQTVNDNIWT